MTQNRENKYPNEEDEGIKYFADAVEIQVS